MKTAVTSHPESTLKKTLSFCIKLLITFTLMGVIFYKVPLSEVMEHYRAISLTTVLAVFGWLLFAFFLSVCRWHILLTTLEAKAPWHLTLKGLLLERFLNQAIPTTLGGDIARSLAVTKPPLTFSASFMSVIMDRIYGLMGLGILILLFTFSLQHFITNSLTFLSILVCITGIVTLCLLVLFLPLQWITNGIQRLTRALPRFDFYSERVQKLLELRRTFSHQRLLLVPGCIGLTFGVHLAQLRVFQILALEVSGTSLSYWNTIILVSPAFFFSLIPVSVSGWGLREMGVIFMLGLIGIPASVAAGASILFGVAYALFSACCGLGYAVYQTWPALYKKPAY